MRITLIATLVILACAIVPHQACHTYSIPDTDELTQGPYWVDEKLNRSDITGGQQGSTFTLTLRLLNKTALAAACAATATSDSDLPLTDGTGVISGAQVDIWYASFAGHYSDYQVEGTLGETWLRGYQITNSSGYVTFNGTFPGWYTSRTTHIHIRVRLYSGSTTTYDDTTQLFFDDTFSDAVYAANSVYNHGTRDTHNSGDNIYQSVMQMTASGSLATGYTSSFNLYYPFATTTSGTTSNPTSGSGTTSNPTNGGSTGGAGPSGAGTPPSGGGPSGGSGTPPSTTTSTPTTTPTTSAPTGASNTTTTSNTTSTAPTTSSPTSTSSSSTGGKTPNHASHALPSSCLLIIASFLMLL